MKFVPHIIFPLTAAFTLGLAGCSKPATDKPADATDKPDAQPKAGVTMDAETQQRIGLKIESPAAAQWQPEVKGYGVVIDPATLSSALMNLETARAAADVSGKELERLKTLTDNVSAHTLEAATGDARRDSLALQSAVVKFKQDWGSALATDGELAEIQTSIADGTTALVRIDLPAGETLSSPPASARIIALTDETKPVTGDFSGATDGVNPQTQTRSYFFLVKNRSIPAGTAVTGYLRISGEPVAGVVVPKNAIVRHDGKGWTYEQTGTNQFVRVEVPLDRLTDGGWFVSENLSATNLIITAGAQTVLSAELSGGGFNTGARD
ncbi:MAG TPA: hypothetical protein VG347_25730 [Verrucomicrobiae bacterium]|nr:hypothetical protein [Verrucomicrobiae bacterium]